MKNKNIEEIAAKLGVAKSTVSRTLRHCSGVDSDTRRMILSECSTERYGSEQFPIYVILPDIPSYFWNRAYNTLVNAGSRSEYPIKYNIYTGLNDTDIVVSYLEEAERLNSEVIIIAAAITPEIHDKIAQIQKKCTVFLLSEYADIVNTFCFGADNYSDGYSAGQICIKHYPEHIPLIVNVPGIPSIGQRIDGFCDAVTQNTSSARSFIDILTIEAGLTIDSRLFSSGFASKLSDRLKAGKKYCVYIPFGTQKLYDALYKLRNNDNFTCICHDTAQSDNISDFMPISTFINQNVEAQAESAFTAAVRYIETKSFPNSKYTFTPSEILIQE